MGLLLRATEVRDDRLGWRWLLTNEATGEPLADHTVTLDPDSREVYAFASLAGYLRWHADPDRRVVHEAELIDQIGAWIGEQVLGDHVGRQIVAAAPTTVRVAAPDFLVLRPLELAHVNGVPLARRGDVSLVFDVKTAARGKQPVGHRLRMVAVFSLPTEATALGLRRERYALSLLVRRLAATQGRAVDLEVLQYGVTRKRLADAMTAEGGPDVLHVSGHGTVGQLLLEHPDGSQDPISTADLMALLAPARRRVKLAVVSACESAAGKVAQTLGLLGFSEQAVQVQAQVVETSEPDAGVAATVARELDCAVVAMRYPVDDEFAIGLADALYDGMFRLNLPLDRALPRAVATAAVDDRPAISIATPTLVGARAVDLSLVPPAAEPLLRETRMYGFPPEPERFVGRSRVMAVASAALALGSSHTAVLFHGMAGAGKTSCAVELAYRHENARFAHGLVFWRAPTWEDEWSGALPSLAATLEQVGLPLADKIATVASLRAFLPRLSRLLADNGLLLVLDNLETLLTPEGVWRDPRWPELVSALVNHNGESRVVLTSRIRPVGLDGRVLVEPVHPMSRNESVLLARELPNLRTLLHTDPASTRYPDADRAMLAEVLQLVQGHPKLLELADAAAADPEKLAAHLAAARATAEQHGAPLATFLISGESSLDTVGFYEVLTSWTTSTLATLPQDARLLLQMLCLAEDSDRHSGVIEPVWPVLWQQLNWPGHVPDPADLLTTLAAAALVHPHGNDGLTRYGVHPGVADAVCAQVSDGLRTAVNTELATWWKAAASYFRGGTQAEHTPTVVHAGLAAAPYLLRLHHWDTATQLLEQAVIRDRSPATLNAALPYLRRIVDATDHPESIGALARTLTDLDSVEAEQLLRLALDRTTADGNFRAAAAHGGILVNLLRDTGRLQEALATLDVKAKHTRAAGLGPWTQLLDRGRRLGILHFLGEDDQVLAELDQIRDEMHVMPSNRNPNETVEPWDVRESILQIGVHAARDLGRWQHALDLNAEVAASARRRGAGPHEIAYQRFNDQGPLVGLGQLDEAEALLRECQQVFEDYQDVAALGRVLTARANLASRRGHHAAAITFDKAALRLTYAQPDPRALAIAHACLANHLARAGTDPSGRLAHRLAAALIRHLTGAHRDESVRALASDLHTLGDRTLLPATLDDLAAQVEQVEGVHFADLIGTLTPVPERAQAALDEFVHAVRTLLDS